MLFKKPSKELIEAKRQDAYKAFDAGQLDEAVAGFEAVAKARPKHAPTHYMLGLAYKYLARWPESLQHNLLALKHGDEDDEGARWNTGIAATAVGDWKEARRQWQACGIPIGEGEGPIEARFGMVSVRLNPSCAGETVYAQRIDPVRSIVRNVPTPESGFRFGDLVLHDGAATGQRRWGEGSVPVFNVLQRLEQSEAKTFTAFVQAPDEDAAAALAAMEGPAVEYLEDWTASIVHLCLRCSYGVPHEHAKPGEAPKAWDTDRSFGIAAHSRVAVERLVGAWAKTKRGRQLQEIVESRHKIPKPRHDHVWWRDPEAPERDDED